MSVWKNFWKFYAMRECEKEFNDLANRPVPTPYAPTGTIVRTTQSIDYSCVTGLDMLMIRLGWHRGNDRYSFQEPWAEHVTFLGVYEGPTKTMVMIVPKSNETMVVLEDEKGLFPSDQLIGTIRLMAS